MLETGETSPAQIGREPPSRPTTIVRRSKAFTARGKVEIDRSQARIAAPQILNIFARRTSGGFSGVAPVPSLPERPRFGRPYEIRSLEPLASPDLLFDSPSLKHFRLCRRLVNLARCRYASAEDNDYSRCINPQHQRHDRSEGSVNGIQVGEIVEIDRK